MGATPSKSGGLPPGGMNALHSTGSARNDEETGPDHRPRLFTPHQAQTTVSTSGRARPRLSSIESSILMHRFDDVSASIVMAFVWYFT